MEIKHEIVKQLHQDTGHGMMVCKQVFINNGYDYNKAKDYLLRHRYSRPLSGCVYTGPDEHDYDFEAFDYDFWHMKFSKREEVYLTADGTIDYKKSRWPERISDIREREARELRRIQQAKEDIKNWKVPTAADIIMSSVNQFLAGVKFRDQYFTYKFPQEYVLNSGKAYRSYIHKEDKEFVWLKFPMKEYMEWNKIGFDDSYYTFNGKSVLLKDLMKKV